jgi:hypothetical protein
MLGVAACALAVILGLRGWLGHGAADASTPPVSKVVEDPASARPAGDLSAAHAGETDGAELLSLEDARARKLGWIPPPPDTLAAVRGQVLDTRTGLPLPGIALTFLSRRPKTAHATTNALGWFATGVELSSGVVSVMHAPDPTDPRFTARWTIEPQQFLLPPAEGSGTTPSEPFTVVLRASAPASELDVDVTLPGGKPAAGASVALTSGRRDAHGEFQAASRSYEVTDAEGRARFSLFGDDVFATSFRVEAEHGGTLASDLLEIDPPLGHAPRRLELSPGGTVRVRAQNDEGRPVSGVSLWLASNEGTRFVTGQSATTDALGEAVFTALRAGCWNVTALHPATGRALVKQVDLGRGGRADVDFRLTVSGLRLGLAGTVLDEEGLPLEGVGVRLQVPDEEAVELTSGEHGTFELWSRAASGVAVSIGGGFLDDRFEPSYLTLPFGTTGFEARRIARIEPETRAFVVVDEETRKPVPSASIVLYHAAQANGLAQSSQVVPAPSGFAQVTFKRRDDTQYIVDAPGYLRAEGRLSELVSTCGQNPLPLRVALTTGFERHLEVRDRATKHTVSGASFQSDGRVLGTSDESGKVTLTNATWPLVVQIVGAGYQPLAWDPRSLAWPSSVIWLEPMR